jgi:Predicted oxidoreductases (related to aryl-alcohol dehydrogenases)
LTGKYKRNQTPNTVRYLTDKYLPTGYFRPEDFDVVENLEEIAKQKGVKPVVLALAWLFNKPYITTVLLGATKPEHLDDAVQALEIKLTEEEMKLLEKPYKPHELMGPTKSPLAP